MMPRSTFKGHTGLLIAAALLLGIGATARADSEKQVKQFLAAQLKP